MTPEERAERRALIRQHHPDRGGDTERFVQIMDALDAAATRPTTTGAASRSWTRRRRARARELRARLPRGLPGARRYATY